MKADKIRQLKENEIESTLKDLKQELSILQGQASMGTPPKNPGRIKQIKKIIARIHTVKNQTTTKEVKNK